MRHLLKSALASLCLAAPAAAQPVTVQFSCDIGGVPAPMRMTVEYQQAFGMSESFRGDISGVFPTGVNIYTSGTIEGQGVGYSFSGANQFADFVEYPSYSRFRVQWVLDGPNNGLWVIVNPFGEGPTRYFCVFQGLG